MRAGCLPLRFRIRLDGPAFDIGERVVVARAARVRRSLARHVRADARRSRSHRRGANRAAAASGRARSGRVCPCRAHDPAPLAGRGGRPRRCRMADRAGGRSPARRGRRHPARSIRRRPIGNASGSGTTTRSCSRCRLGQVSVILPGDIGREGEARALEHLEARADHRAESPAPRQRDVEHARVPEARQTRRRRSSAPAATTASAIPRRSSSSAIARWACRCSRPRRTAR